MKKLIVTIICVLFASTSFAQMVGASSIAKQSAPKTTLGVKKHEFSIHGGIGLISSYFDTPAFSIGMKYKYKPSDKYDIRLLGEIGTAFAPSANLIDYGLSIIPIMAGVNYEYRFTKSISIWTDFAFGISIPLSDERFILYWDYGSDGYIDKICDKVSSFKTGFASSAEIGMNYNDFSFSFKGVFSVNECFAPFSIIGYEYSYNSFYLLFQVGYHF